MPLYFFDIEDSELEVADDAGVELPDLAAAQAVAALALAESARDILPISTVGERTFVVRVRTENGRRLLTARLTFTAEPEN